VEVAESKISSQWSTHIPPEVRPWLRAKEGDFLVWVVSDGKVEVRKK